MDITLYDDLFNAVETYLGNEYPSVKVVHYAPNDPKYPIVVLNESRNTPTYVARQRRQTAASMGYSFNIYASNVGTQTQQSIARIIAKKIDDFMFLLNGISRTSYNEFANVDGQGKVYRVTMVYSMQYFENKKIVY